MAKQVAVLLAGCGVYDGSEIHEAVLSLLALEKHGAVATCFAPNIEQSHTINHLSGEVSGETRNVLIESARIARGKVRDLSEYDAEQYDVLLLPGGFGAAKNLCSFAFEGADMSINPQVAQAVQNCHAAGKVIGAMCIAPVILAKLIPGCRLTLGDEGDASKGAEAMGASHVVADHAELVVDEDKRVVTTPCYMLDATISQIAAGIDKLVEAVLKLA